MTRIEKTFAALSGRPALITFIMAGDPDAATSQAVLDALPGAGADIIELGMPFTDPMADGPTIQAAGLRALKAGQDMHKTLKMVQQFRSKNDATPIVLMGYFNPVLQYGVQEFMEAATKAGVDGLILVDLPPEEAAETIAAAKAQNIDIIRLLTPTTDAARLPKVLKDASGFLYYVSITGVTGAAKADLSTIKPHIAEIKKHTGLPIAIGFGIKTPDDAAAMGKIADAIVVGSAIVENMAGLKKPDAITAQVTALKKALG